MTIRRHSIDGLQPILLAALLAACGGAPQAPVSPTVSDEGASVSQAPGGAPSTLTPSRAPTSLADAPLIAPDDPTPLPEPTDAGIQTRRLSICQRLQADLAASVGLAGSDFQLRPADVPNAAYGNILDGCRLSWAGPGERLAFGTTASDMPVTKAQRALLQAGWEEDADYIQDQPGSFVRGYVQGNRLCLLDIRFRPPAGRPCPADDPVTCGLGPAELDYAISLSCADF